MKENNLRLIALFWYATARQFSRNTAISAIHQQVTQINNGRIGS